MNRNNKKQFNCPVRRFPSPSQVRLLPGTPFYEAQNNMNDFLLAQDPDRLLYNFRSASGLDTLGAEPMTGWDAEDCKLKGHTTGHFLSGLALAYAGTGDLRFREKSDYMIHALHECQEAFSTSDKTAPGFLSAYDETQFDLLEQFTKYPEIWAPYYTLDKIMSGLLDSFELTGSREALEILDPLGTWVYRRLSVLSPETRSKMWSMYIAGEYGAMIGTMVRLFRITGKEEHLKAAFLFENEKLFGQMAAGIDELNTMHANQHIPQAIGAFELYTVTGEKRYLDIAENFCRIVNEHHSYIIGGNGEEERFHEPDRECEFLTEKTAESCASYNMLRLMSKLFTCVDRADLPHLMDRYERTLFNHILMSFSHKSDGGTTYFLPLAPGSAKYYETLENSCCHGTGMESRYRYVTQIFSFEEDVPNGESLIRINLPVSAALAGEESLSARFTDDGVLTVTADADMRSRIAVRIPGWAIDRYEYRGSTEMIYKDGYLYAADPMKKGSSFRIFLPMQMRIIPSDSDKSYVAAACGPYLMAALSDKKEFLKIDEIRRFCLVPLYKIDRESYHIYFKNVYNYTR